MPTCLDPLSTSAEPERGYGSNQKSRPGYSNASQYGVDDRESPAPVQPPGPQLLLVTRPPLWGGGVSRGAASRILLELPPLPNPTNSSLSSPAQPRITLSFEECKRQRTSRPRPAGGSTPRHPPSTGPTLRYGPVTRKSRSGRNGDKSQQPQMANVDRTRITSGIGRDQAPISDYTVGGTNQKRDSLRVM